jgi:hypothetical protein
MGGGGGYICIKNTIKSVFMVSISIKRRTKTLTAQTALLICDKHKTSNQAHSYVALIPHKGTSKTVPAMHHGQI